MNETRNPFHYIDAPTQAKLYVDLLNGMAAIVAEHDDMDAAMAEEFVAEATNAIYLMRAAGILNL